VDFVLDGVPMPAQEFAQLGCGGPVRCQTGEAVGDFLGAALVVEAADVADDPEKLGGVGEVLICGVTATVRKMRSSVRPWPRPRSFRSIHNFMIIDFRVVIDADSGLGGGGGPDGARVGAGFHGSASIVVSDAPPPDPKISSCAVVASMSLRHVAPAASEHAASTSARPRFVRHLTRRSGNQHRPHTPKQDQSSCPLWGRRAGLKLVTSASPASAAPIFRSVSVPSAGGPFRAENASAAPPAPPAPIFGLEAENEIIKTSPGAESTDPVNDQGIRILESYQKLEPSRR